MKVERTSLNTTNGEGDDLSETLRAFFRSEMPQPWPDKPQPDPARNGSTTLRIPSSLVTASPTTVKPTEKRPWLTKSRFALAASVALLLGGHLALSDQFAPGVPERNGLLEGTMSDRRANPGADLGKEKSKNLLNNGKDEMSDGGPAFELDLLTDD